MSTEVLNTDSFERSDREIIAGNRGAHRTVAIDPDNSATFTPTGPSYVGTGSCLGTVTSSGVTETAAVEVTMANKAPTSVANANVVLGDTVATGNLVANDTDAEGAMLTVTHSVVAGQSVPAGNTATISGVGSLTIEANGAYHFIPWDGWNGSAPQTATDGRTKGSDTSKLEVTVTVVADVANDTLTVTQFVVDAQTFAAGDAAILAGMGSLTTAASGAQTFTLESDWDDLMPQCSCVATDGRTNDSHNSTGDNAVTVTLSNNARMTVADTSMVSKYTVATGNVLGNDFDPEGDTLTVTQFTVGGQTIAAGSTAIIAGAGALTMDSDGTYTFTPTPDWNGIVPLVIYTATDGSSNGDYISPLDITITPMSDASTDTAKSLAGVPVITPRLNNGRH